jgi:hypothetical protein
MSLRGRHGQILPSLLLEPMSPLTLAFVKADFTKGPRQSNHVLTFGTLDLGQSFLSCASPMKKDLLSMNPESGASLFALFNIQVIEPVLSIMPKASSSSPVQSLDR